MLVSPKAESKTNRDTILKLGGSWVRNVLGVKKKRGGIILGVFKERARVTVVERHERRERGNGRGQRQERTNYSTLDLILGEVRSHWRVWEEVW